MLAHQPFHSRGLWPTSSMFQVCPGSAAKSGGVFGVEVAEGSGLCWGVEATDGVGLDHGVGASEGVALDQRVEVADG